VECFEKDLVDISTRDTIPQNKRRLYSECSGPPERENRITTALLFAAARAVLGIWGTARLPVCPQRIGWLAR
jgi:hypothetical protein